MTRAHRPRFFCRWGFSFSVAELDGSSHPHARPADFGQHQRKCATKEVTRNSTGARFPSLAHADRVQEGHHAPQETLNLSFDGPLRLYEILWSTREGRSIRPGHQLLPLIYEQTRRLPVKRQKTRLALSHSNAQRHQLAPTQGFELPLRISRHGPPMGDLLSN